MRSRVLAFAAWLVVAAVATPALARNPWEGSPPYGLHLMSRREVQLYWDSIRALPTVEEQEVYWLAHVEKMKRRALARGVSIEDPPRKPIPESEQRSWHSRAPYMNEIMTPEEVLHYHETLEGMDAAARRDYIAAHIEKMERLSLLRGFSPPSPGEFADDLAPPRKKKTRGFPVGPRMSPRPRTGNTEKEGEKKAGNEGPLMPDRAR